MMQVQRALLRPLNSTRVTLLARLACTSTKPLTQRQLAQKRRAKMMGLITDHYVFGSCEQGQLGLGEMEELVLAPKKIDGLEGLSVKKLAVGHNHSIALLKEDKLLVWGYNKNGQLGLGHNNHVATPTELPPLEGHRIIDVVAGPLQTWVITENLKTGKQAIWHTGAGYAESGELKFTMTRNTLTKVKKSSFLGETKIDKIIPAGDFCLWIDGISTVKSADVDLVENGQIYSFGVNASDAWQLGQGYEKMTEVIPQPTPIPTLAGEKFKDAAVGWGHTIAITEDNKVFSWGSNIHGQCGLGHRSTPVRAPKEIEALRGVQIAKVACGETHSMVVDVNGKVYVWGSYAEGKLGLGDSVDKDIFVPTRLEFLDDKNIIHISAGTDHSAALSRTGEFYVWGFGQHGALTIRSGFQNMKTPLEITLPRFVPNGNEEEEVEMEEEEEEIDPSTLRPMKLRLVENNVEVEDKEILVTPEQEEMILRMEQLPRPRIPAPDPTGYSMEHEDYPFIIEGQKVTEGEFFDRKYVHLPVDVQCGMDSTVITVVSTPCRE